MNKNVTLGISQQILSTRTTDDSMVIPLAASTHVQSNALPLSTSELTVVKIKERQKKLTARAAGIPSLATSYTKSAVMNGFWDH